mgnify:CR=1 FL=1
MVDRTAAKPITVNFNASINVSIKANTVIIINDGY